MKKVTTLLIATLLLAVAISVQAADYTNSIGMEFKNIPAGSFYMGINGSYANSKDDERPRHKVTITRPFQMGVFEVTVGQFKKFIVDADRDDLLSDGFIGANSYGDDAAVSYVSWKDAQAFIRWLNKKEGCDCYRLPTEAEWEYAARAGTTTHYSWGDDAGRAGEYAWYYGNASHHAHAVGRKKPNPWGLYDMHGNVWEWVQDWYDRNYYRHSPEKDPKGPATGRYRVIRGGGWDLYARNLRSAFRLDSYSPGNRFGFLGFRLVRRP